MSSALMAAEGALAQATRALGAAAIKGGAKYAARRIQRRFRKNKSTKARNKKRRANKKKYGKKGAKFNIANLSHGGITKHYHYNNLKYCVSEELRLYNVGRHSIQNQVGFEDNYQTHDSFTITNNGYNSVNGTVGTSNFTGNDITQYTMLDYTHGLGKWRDESEIGTGGVESSRLSNQIWHLRSNFKLWKKDMISFTIRWESKINNLHGLEVPEGYYRVVQPMTVKDKLGSTGLILLDTATDAEVYRTDTRKISDHQALDRQYGTPVSMAVGPTYAGAFPNKTQASLLNLPPQELFTYENIARNPAGWKKIPRKRQFQISEKYSNPFSLTTKSNIFQDPIILFVYKNVPTSWYQQTVHTHGTSTNATDGVDTYSSPDLITEVIPAHIAVIKTLHCYSFKNRAEDIVKIPDNYPYQGGLIPN